MLIPDSFQQSDEEPTNADGAWYYDENGASLTVSGANNISGDTPESYLTTYYSNAEYSYVGEDYMIFSCHEQGYIYYIVKHVDAEIEYGFELYYPEALADDYETIIQELQEFVASGEGNPL